MRTRSFMQEWQNNHSALGMALKGRKGCTMKQSVNSYDFERAFVTMGRKDQFSYDGLKALFDYLEEYEDDIGEELELDVVALCCDYCEYDSALECAKDYPFDIDEDLDEDEQEEAALEYLRDHTTVIEFNTGIIIQSF